jgi:hypothetical protein
MAARVFGLVLLVAVVAGCEERGQGGNSSRGAPPSPPLTVEARERYRATFGVRVAGPETGGATPLYAAATILNPWGRLDSFTSGGTGSDYPFEVILTPFAAEPGGKLTPIAAFDPGLAARIARDTASAEDAVRFASVVAGSTFCRGGAVTLNSGVGRKIGAPGDVAAVLAASGAAGRDVIPAGVTGTSIPAVERLATSSGPSFGSQFDGRPGWVVRLRCSLWRG